MPGCNLLRGNGSGFVPHVVPGDWTRRRIQPWTCIRELVRCAISGT